MQKRKIQNELNTPCLVKNLPLNHGAIAAPYKTNFLPSSGVCHLTIYGGHCHVGPPPLQLLVKEGKSKFLALVRSASGQLALVESDGPRRRSARNNGDAESRRGRPPPPSPRGGGADLRLALHRPAR